MVRLRNVEDGWIECNQMAGKELFYMVIHLIRSGERRAFGEVELFYKVFGAFNVVKKGHVL